jgi:hypothetical protein
MVRKLVALIATCVLFTTTGCDRASKNATSEPMAQMAPMEMSAHAESPQRFIAIRHKLAIISPESELPTAWQSVITFCGTIQCELLSSDITTKTRDSAPSGSISLRVSPEDSKKLFAYIEKQGSIVQHTTESEDKTVVVVDTEARIKNLTSFRDNLRTMLAKPSATVKDSVEIQQQLTEVQSQLDSATAQRKILANETEKIAVEIAFRVEGAMGGTRGFAQIMNALRESGSVLADSTASLITVIVAVIPWLILIVPVCWLVARLWRRLRRKRTGSAPPPPAKP